MAAAKLSGDSSRAGDSTDEDLDSGERDLDSLDSLRCLTGILACLTGVLTFLSGSLARLRKELTVLCGVWRNLSGDSGILSGVLAGMADLLLVESCLGAGAADWSGGQAGATGTLDWSIRRCSNVHIDIKSTRVSWLMDLGMEGKSRLLVPVDLEMSGPSPGEVAAGVPSRASVGRRAGQSVSSGSSNCSSDSTSETSAGSSLAGSSTVGGPSPVMGRHLYLNRHLWPCRCLQLCRCVLPGRHLCLSRCLLPGRHLPGRLPPVPGLGRFNINLPGWRRDHRDRSLLRRLGILGGQLDIPSGDVRLTRPVGTLSSSLMTLRRPAVGRRPRWSWWKGSTIARRMMMMGVRHLRDTARLGTPPGAGTARGTWPGPLALSPGAVTPDVSENPVVCRPCVFACALYSWTCGGPTRESWAVPPPRRWKPRTWVERIQTSWLWFSSASSWTIPRTWNAWKEVESPLPERVSPRNRPWSLQLSWLPSPPLRPCVDFSERWPWLAQPTPQATSPYKRDRDCLKCKVIALHWDGIVGSEDGCHSYKGNASSQGT